MNYPVAMPTLLKFEPKLLDQVQILPFTATKVFPVFCLPHQSIYEHSPLWAEEDK